MIFNKHILRFTIPLLHYCNLSCSYCHVPNERHEYLDFEIYKKAVDFFYETEGYIKNLVLYWWEPLLLKDIDLEKFVDYANYKKLLYPEKKVEVTIVTNLTVLRDSQIPILEKIDNVCVSVDGNETSHNQNRWLFLQTSQNFFKLKKNKVLSKKLTINKVVNKVNVWTFFEDTLFLLEQFSCPITYNAALTVNDWDSISISSLADELSKLFVFYKKYEKSEYIHGFFRLWLKSCPFWTLSLWLDGKIYNCEFIANDTPDSQKVVFDLNKNQLIHSWIQECFYDTSHSRCISESCIICQSLCTRFSFQNKKFLLEDWISYLKKVKKTRSLHIQHIREELKNSQKNSVKIQLKNISYNSLFLVNNFLYSFHESLGIVNFHLYTSQENKKNKLLLKILGLLIAKSSYKVSVDVYTFDWKDNSSLLEIDLSTSFVFFNSIYIWNLHSEIDTYFFKEIIF